MLRHRTLLGRFSSAVSAEETGGRSSPFAAIRLPGRYGSRNGRLKTKCAWLCLSEHMVFLFFAFPSHSVVGASNRWMYLLQPVRISLTPRCKLAVLQEVPVLMDEQNQRPAGDIVTPSRLIRDKKCIVPFADPQSFCAEEASEQPVWSQPALPSPSLDAATQPCSESLHGVRESLSGGVTQSSFGLQRSLESPPGGGMQSSPDPQTGVGVKA